jgi:triacylglycerol lipase
MQDLISTPGEVMTGIKFMTICSDSNDKYAQPDGGFIGLPNVPTGLGYEAPELQGATNVLLAAVDHW